MYDSLETELPSSLPGSLSVPPGDPRAAAAGAFGVRSQTIPPYTSPRSRTALSSRNSQPAPPQTHGVFPFAADTKCSSSAVWNEAGPGRQVVGLLEFEANLFPAERRKKASTASAAVTAAGEEEYSTLLPEKKEKSHFCESLDDEIQASFKSEDSRSGGQGGVGDRLLRRIGRTETDLLSFKSEENPDFCSVDSDEAQSLIPDSSDRLTRTSSLSLSELLGRTPNLTSDSEGLSIDDYPCLDPNVTRSITEENSYEDSDYEELLAKDASPGANDTISSQNSSALNSLARARDSRCNRRPYQAPHYSDHPTKTAENVGDHFNVLSRCSNKKLKSAADKIFAAKIKVHSTRADCGGVGRNTGFENCPESKHVDDVVNPQLNRPPSFLKASSDSRGQRDAAVGTSASGSQDFEQNGRGAMSKISPPFPVAAANISASPSHDYYNVARFNFKQRTEPLLARRKLNSPSKSVAPITLPTKRSEDLNKVDGAVPRKTLAASLAGFQSLGGSREYKRGSRRLLLRRRQNKQTVHGGARNSSSDSDDKSHNHAALTSSSESDTVTGEKPPSSQDDGYSSNSLPSESSLGRQAAQLGRFGRREEMAWQEASVEIVEIVAIPKNLSFEFMSDRRSERKRLQQMRIRRNLEASVDEEDELTDSQTDNYHNDLQATSNNSPDKQHLSEKTEHLDKDTLNDNAIPPPDSTAPSDDENK